ncbi:uncharacterized protein MYCGRDRAFT_107215 [Zymoseptoria tritici IPO323]|uniref:Uncharacterized protein n=1 Tax=Zymoseptoria tritici (strain CBS 115943 / IPO323) TaxID=336722 RepID=F9X026_ZYMTI|nr:uncharacterized protein MYCGRDRAFT_107215 [Zymoseptoria tritici IPO323]EGP91272.1 hypothetical protein MYCGRDRAFT_107215 [Zymoseptoria tritici IPO323]
MESHPPPFRRFASKRFNATTTSTEPQPGPPSDDIISGLSDMNISKHSWMSRSKSHKHHDSHIRTQPALRDAKSTLDMKASHQSRWRGVPLAFRPSEWLEPETSRKPTAPDHYHARSQSALPPRTSPPKQRRRPEPLRSTSGGCRDPTCVTNSAPLAAPLVFPQYSPYNDTTNFISSPKPQPVSVPNKPSETRSSQRHPPTTPSKPLNHINLHHHLNTALLHLNTALLHLTTALLHLTTALLHLNTTLPLHNPSLHSSSPLQPAPQSSTSPKCPKPGLSLPGHDRLLTDPPSLHPATMRRG